MPKHESMGALPATALWLRSLSRPAKRFVPNAAEKMETAANVIDGVSKDVQTGAVVVKEGVSVLKSLFEKLNIPITSEKRPM